MRKKDNKTVGRTMSKVRLIPMTNLIKFDQDLRISSKDLKVQKLST